MGFWVGPTLVVFSMGKHSAEAHGAYVVNTYSCGVQTINHILEPYSTRLNSPWSLHDDRSLQWSKQVETSL